MVSGIGMGPLLLWDNETTVRFGLSPEGEFWWMWLYEIYIMVS